MELEIGGSLAVQVHSSLSFVTVSAVKQSQSIKAICEPVQSFAPTAETVDLMLAISFRDFWKYLLKPIVYKLTRVGDQITPQFNG